MKSEGWIISVVSLIPIVLMGTSVWVAVHFVMKYW